MTAKSFAKLNAQIAKLLELLSDEELVAAAEGTAQLALTVEFKGQAKKVGGTAKKPKAPSITPQQMVDRLHQCANRGDAMTLIEDSKFTGDQLKATLALLNLPVSGKKADFISRLQSFVGVRADGAAIRST